MLEIKGDTDHTKLIEMLDALNDESQKIDDVLDTYFDTENTGLLVGVSDPDGQLRYAEP